MLKQKKKVIGLGILFIISCICCILLSQMQEEQTGEAQVQSNQDIRHKLFTLQGVERIQVRNQTAEYCFEKSDGGFCLSGQPQEKLDLKRIQETVSALSDIKVVMDLGEQKDLKQFGLSGEQAAAILLEGNDGREEQFLIGNLMPDTAYYCYVLYQDRVYAAESFPEAVFGTVYDYYDLVLIRQEQGEERPQTEEKAELSDFRLEGSHVPQPVVIQRDETAYGGYVMTEPVYAEAMFAEENDAGAITVMQALSELEALKLVCPQADDTILRECGLKEPYAQVSYTLSGQKHQIRVSKKQADGTRYMMVDEKPEVYMVADEAVSVWAESDAMDYRPDYLWLVSLMELEQVSISFEDCEEIYQISSREEGEEKVKLKVTHNGVVLDSENLWQPFYQKLLGMSVLDMQQVQVSAEKPVLRVRYHFQEQYGKKDVETAFYTVEGSDRYAATLNGEYAGVLRKSTVDEVIGLAKKVSRHEGIE